MDLKSAFWQIELNELSFYLNVFHANNKLRYKRLTIGLKRSKGELHVALKPIFVHINNVYISNT